MKTIFYQPEQADTDKKFQKLADRVNSMITVETVRTIEDLKLNLGKPKHDLAFVVLCANSKHELISLLEIKNYLEDVKILLIVPDGRKETISLGFKLYPRFITSINDDYYTLTAIIIKMVNNLIPGSNIGKKDSGSNISA